MRHTPIPQALGKPRISAKNTKGHFLPCPIILLRTVTYNIASAPDARPRSPAGYQFYPLGKSLATRVFRTYHMNSHIIKLNSILGLRQCC